MTLPGEIERKGIISATEQYTGEIITRQREIIALLTRLERRVKSRAVR